VPDFMSLAPRGFEPLPCMFNGRSIVLSLELLSSEHLFGVNQETDLVQSHYGSLTRSAQVEIDSGQDMSRRTLPATLAASDPKRTFALSLATL